jgi:hypothetical protein
MNRNVILNVAAGLCMFVPTALTQAQEAEPAQIRLSHGVLRYDMVTEKSDDGTGSTKQESSGFTTFPAGIEIAAFWQDYAVYAYPVTTGGSFALGKAFGGNQEAGVTASLNSYNVKDGDESTYNSIGAYYYYSRPLSSNLTFEFDFVPALIMGNEKTSTGGSTPVTQERDGSGYSLYLDLLGVIPLAKNFEYVFGIDYTLTKTETKVKTPGVPETTEKFDSSNLGLIVAKFRFFI